MISSLGRVVIVLFFAVTSPSLAQPWNTHVVDDAGDMGYSTRVVTTSDGTPYVLYQNINGLVRLGWWVATSDTTGGWEHFVVSGSSGPHGVGLTVDANDLLHIAYSTFSPAVYYGVFATASKSWAAPPVVVASLSGGVDMALFETTSAQVPGIACRRSFDRSVHFVTRDSLTLEWSTEIVETVLIGNGVPSIAVDSQGRFHAVFDESAGANLMYATRVGELWTKQYVAVNGSVGSYNAIVVDESDNIHVVYYDASNQDLWYATPTAP